MATLLHAGLHRYDDEWSWSTAELPADWLGGCLLGTVLTGRGSVRGPGREPIELAAGVVYLLQLSEKEFRFRSNGQAPLTVAWMHVSPLPHRQARGIATCQLVAEPIFWERLAHRAIAAHLQGDGRSADAWLAVALHELAHPAATSPEPVDASHVAQVDSVCRRIRANPGHRWRLDDVAAAVGVSRSQLVRLFRRYRNTTPAAYAMQCRIDAARSYLRMTEWSIVRIAAVLGYCDSFAFSRQFREQTGQSPTDYRSAHVQTRRPDADEPGEK